MASYEILNEVVSGPEGNWRICFQWGVYHHDDREDERGYRFIWRKPDGSLQPARGQARIPDAATIFELLRLATEAGWFIRAENL